MGRTLRRLRHESKIAGTAILAPTYIAAENMRFLAAILPILVILNAWITVRLARAPLASRLRLLFTAGTWLVPFLGAWIAHSRMRTPAMSRPEDSQAVRTPAPDALELPGMQRFELAQHLRKGQGFPILDWARLTKWAARTGDPQQQTDAIEKGRAGWLLHLRDAIGRDAHLLETDTAWVLSTCPPRIAGAAARFVATMRKRITAVLDGVAQFPAGHRSILVMFDNRDPYYRYVTNYYPDEGEFAYSGGMFVDRGCPHLLMVRDDLALLEPVIAHEMTHSALAYLSLPLWLDEGIAVSTEQQVAHSPRNVHYAIELLNKHADFWNRQRLQEFWSGQSFYRTDDGQALSYDLAQKMVALIGREWTTFQRFVHGAKRADAGAASAKSELQMDLGQLAASAIRLEWEAGWSPNPAAWASVATRAR